MKSTKALFQEVVDSIELDESRDEISSIAYFLVTGMFGINKTDILSGKMVPFSDHTARALQRAVQRINSGEPVQYVLGEEYFFGRKFHVNPSVLIPRPETEGVVRVVVDHVQSARATEKKNGCRIVDIGTGSGCIAITLSCEIPGAQVFATDVSTAALSVAVDNANIHGAEVTFIEHDILTERIPVSDIDVIVSNPPYIPLEQKGEMESNVLEHEPHTALFVDDDDPLIFYREIVNRAGAVLNDKGLLAVEINERFADDVAALFLSAGFKNVEKYNDVAGKPRVVTGRK